MSLNDPLANVLASIKNYESLGKKLLHTKSNSDFIRKVLTILKENTYIGAFEEIPDGKGNILKINLLGRINDIKVIKPKFAVKKNKYQLYEKRFLPAQGFGIIIVSTNKGLMIHEQAKKQNLGGKLICYCY